MLPGIAAQRTLLARHVLRRKSAAERSQLLLVAAARAPHHEQAINPTSGMYMHLLTMSTF